MNKDFNQFVPLSLFRFNKLFGRVGAIKMGSVSLINNILLNGFNFETLKFLI